ncbi:MAG: hypothetical protein QNI85_06515 [Desulfobacterales bacterium]|nr:hypothetical protein [Desulfobacterales bacterium]
MARIESYLLKPIDLTVHRVRGVLQGDDLRRTGKRFYAQEVTLNVLWDFSGADLTQIPSEEIILKDFGRVREAVCGPDGAVYAVVNDPDEILRISARGRTAR